VGLGSLTTMNAWSDLRRLIVSERDYNGSS
jgi:hypothetical protein